MGMQIVFNNSVTDHKAEEGLQSWYLRKVAMAIYENVGDEKSISLLMRIIRVHLSTMTQHL